MRAFAERHQYRATAPSDLTWINSQLMWQKYSEDDARAALAEHNDSWQGVQGQFRDSLVEVESTFVVAPESWHPPTGSRTTPAIGRLGALQVVTVELVLPQNKYWQPDGGEARYSGTVIAATLSPAPTDAQVNRDGLVAEDSLVAISLEGPFSGYGSAQFHRVSIPDQTIN